MTIRTESAIRALSQKNNQMDMENKLKDQYKAIERTFLREVEGFQRKLNLYKELHNDICNLPLFDGVDTHLEINWYGDKVTICYYWYEQYSSVTPSDIRSALQKILHKNATREVDSAGDVFYVFNKDKLQVKVNGATLAKGCKLVQETVDSTYTYFRIDCKDKGKT
tara:strand:+ start:1732 stop:2229 length:498 start_codon:yes stop_codon:yes gene_type:complete